MTKGSDSDHFAWHITSANLAGNPNSTDDID